MEATSKGFTQVVEVLLKNGADPNTENYVSLLVSPFCLYTHTLDTDKKVWGIMRELW